MATALTNYVQQKHDSYVALKAASQTGFTEASNQLDSALLAYQTLVDEASVLESDIAGKRAAMSAASNMPSDVEALAEELRQLLINRRHNVAAVANAAEVLNFAQVVVASAKFFRDQMTNLLAATVKELSAVQKRQGHHDSWVSVETEDAISAVRDIATDLLAENPITVADGEDNPADTLAAARARIESDIPAVLLARARVRGSLVDVKRSSFDAFLTAIDGHKLSHSATSAGSSGLLAQRWAEYEAVEKNLKHYALTSVSRYQNALSRLASVVESSSLTSAESDHIATLALADDAEALVTEEALHSVRAAIVTKRLDIELAIVAARVADVNADSALDANVISEKAELASLEADLAVAEAAHTPALATEIDLWEGAIPDAIWANLQAYDSAIASFNAISVSDSTALVTAFTDAESALVIAAEADDENIRLGAALTAAQEIARPVTKYVNGTENAVRLSATRGDY